MAATSSERRPRLCSVQFYCATQCRRSRWRRRPQRGAEERRTFAPAKADPGGGALQRLEAPCAEVPAEGGVAAAPCGSSGRSGPALSEGDIRVALVATLRDVGDQLLDWIEWHRIVGFAHLFLYFDDPAHDDAAIRKAQGIYSERFLSVLRNGPELKAEWPTLRSWEEFSAYTDDRMCRQLLNIAHCVRHALRADVGSPQSVDWLMHLDHDELFLPPRQGLQAHFRHLEKGGCRLCLYQNYEAVPEDHTRTPFSDVTLFRVPLGRVPKTPNGQRGTEFWASRTKARTFFLYYDNGKSAVRVRRANGREFAPRSVHVLCPEDDRKALEKAGAAWTTLAEQDLEQLELGWMVPRSDEVVVTARVLHYPATHYEQLFRKYDHLKNFPSVRFGGGLIVPPSFHLEARDCYVQHALRGEAIQKDKLKALLEGAAMLRTPEAVTAQLENGTVERVTAVRESLQCGRWCPPDALVEDPEARLLRQPTIEGMARLSRMPRKAAEVLLKNHGGLLKDPERGLDMVARRLEAVGWAACALGGNPGIVLRAREEARRVEKRMTPGTTVVKNQVVDQRMPRAQRGDKILWMQDRGGAGAPDKEGSALALLESAIEEIGMKLDVRLQRGKLRLRITERCDGMLACYDGKGAAYGPHIDNADGDGRLDGRVLTAILYLNPGWDPKAGGELSIFEPDPGFEDLASPGARGQWHDVRPEAGTLVFFRADKMLHEVRPSYASRCALSMWFCGMPVRS